MPEEEDYYAEKMATIDILKMFFRPEQTVAEVLQLLEEECQVLGRS